MRLESKKRKRKIRKKKKKKKKKKETIYVLNQVGQKQEIVHLRT
jgi:hypothetical protein